MKSKITMLLGLLCLVSTAFGQIANKKSKNPKWQKIAKLTRQLQKMDRLNETVKKSRGVEYRVIAETYESTGQDSSIYSYSGSRGNVLDEYGFLTEDYNNDYGVYFRTVNPDTIGRNTTNTYNNDNLLILSIDSSKATGVYVPESKMTNVYNASGQLIDQIREYWNGSSWTNSYKTENFYTGSNMTKSESKNWNGTAWENSGKTEFIYTSGNLTEETYYTWSNNQWMGQYKYLYTYNASNLLTQDVEQTYNSPLWEDSYRSTYTYNVSNKLNYIIWENKNVSNQWENESRLITQWTANKISNYDLQEWTNNQWANYEQYSYTYDSNNNLISAESATWNGTAYVFDLTNYDYKSRYYYETYNTSVGLQETLLSSHNIKLYPNPATNEIYVSVDKLRMAGANILITNMNGENILSHTVTANTMNISIPVSGLASGVYNLQLTNGTTIYQPQLFIKN